MKCLQKTNETAKNLLTDKSGFTMIQWVALVMALLMIVIFIMTFLTAISTISYQRQIAKQALDQYVEENAIEIYKMIKQNSDRTDSALPEKVTAILVKNCDLIEDSGRYKSEMNNGGARYYISNIDVQFEEDYTAKLVLSYDIKVPIRFGGFTPIWAEIPISIVSRFTPKF